MKIDWCQKCEKKDNLICKKCQDNYALVQKRNKCYIFDEKGLNSYYLTFDENGNYILNYAFLIEKMQWW